MIMYRHFLSLIAHIVKYIREYLSEGWDGRGFVEQLEEDDDGNYVWYAEAYEVDGGLNVTETNQCLQENKQDVNINIHDNGGISDSMSLLFPQLESPQYPESSFETELDKKTDLHLAVAGTNKQKKETIMRKKRKPQDDINTKTKLPSFKMMREAGEWEKHDETIECLMKYYDHDDDNYDIMLLLNYEKAVGLYQRNDLNNSCELLNKVYHELVKVLSTTNVTQNMIYVRCLLLASDICCRRKRFGKAEKALNKVRDLLDSSNSALLKTEFHLAQARYYLRQVEQQSNHSLHSCIENVIKETQEAERVACTLKNDNTKIWTTLRMEILLKRSNAILKLAGDHEERAETLKHSLDEINHTLYDKSPQITKVKYRQLMCCYYESLGNLKQAAEQAKVGLEIAEKCGFHIKKKQLIKKIEAIEKSLALKNLSCKNSAEVVQTVLHLNTTDTGNVESNAVEQSCGDIFSGTDVFSGDEEIIGNSSFQDLVADGEGADLYAGASTVHVPPDHEKLTEREQTRLATHVGSFWMELLGLLNIVHEKKEEILQDVKRFPNINSRAKEVLHIYNQQKEFSRKDLAKLVEQDLQLREEAGNITSGGYRILAEHKESKTFESVRGAECALDDLHGAHADVPADNEMLTEREQTRLAKHLNPHWYQLSGLLNIDDSIRRSILTNLHYTDDIIKAKEILHIYNKRRADFSRKNLAELVGHDLKLPDEAEAIIKGTYQSI